MPNYLTVYDDVPAKFARTFENNVTDWIRNIIVPKLEQLLGNALPLDLSKMTFDGECLTLGDHTLKIILMTGRPKNIFVPVQDRINHKYIKAAADEVLEIMDIIEAAKDSLDYGFWKDLPGALKRILEIMEGDVDATEASKIRTIFHPYFCLEIGAMLRRKPGIDLFKHLMMLTLLFEEMLVLPDNVLGNFFPKELVSEGCCAIEIYTDALENYHFTLDNVVAHEFFHFIHYACIKDAGGEWLAYNDNFTHNVAVIESLARYFDGASETLGVFPGNPYFGANYLKAHDLLSQSQEELHLLPQPTFIRNELNVREASAINRMYAACANKQCGTAFRKTFALSLEDMGRAYDYLSALRTMCNNQMQFTYALNA